MSGITPLSPVRKSAPDKSFNRRRQALKISGRARVTIETAPVEEFEMAPGDGLIVPKGVWHRVDILEPSQIVFVTPGPGGEYRPLGSTG